MKIGLFSDSHYSSALLTCGVRYNSLSLDKIRNGYEEFSRCGCDLVICLGDLTDSEEDHLEETRRLGEIADIMSAFPFPTLCLMGNHDAFTFTEEEFYSVLGEDKRPRRIDTEDKVLMFIDGCYFSCGKRYSPGDKNWRDTYFPFRDRLEKELTEADKEVILFSHQNIDLSAPSDHRMSNAEELNGIIAASGKVSAVYQGHYHKGLRSRSSGIDFITLPAVCENENAFFVIEI